MTGPAYPSRWSVAWRVCWSRAYVRAVGLNREPSWILADTILPVLATAAFLLTYRALGAPEHYGAYVVLGAAMTAYWLNVLWSLATQLHFEKESGNLQVAMAAPAPVGALLAGMALGGMVATTTRALAVLLSGVLFFGVRFALPEPGLCALAFVATLAALYAMGASVASLFLVYGREGWQVAQMTQEPVTVLAGFYFPVRELGGVAATAASILPLTLGLDALRQTAVPGGVAEGWLPVGTELGLLGVLAVGFGALARFSLRRLEARARREGQLTLRWQ